MYNRLRALFVLLLILLLAVLSGFGGNRPARAIPHHLGYGFNLASLDYGLMQSLGFDWAKLFGAPGGPQPVRTLVRVDANQAHSQNPGAFAASVRQLAAASGAYIDAYEIGNEPNLDASYGWAAPPVAADYVSLLCLAFAEIKAVDPTAIVVSAGLAPTGRVSGTWNGHPGHNGLFQDEREYLRELLAAGGGACLDVVGYHPYGFSADFDAPPDVADSDPARNCTNGFCFRGAEKIYEIMVGHGLGGKKVWATEFGWITEPPTHCLSEPGWQGRAWQIVSEQKQAQNLRGAFTFAHENWPWMGAMFVFNLNFNTAPWYQECEQMRFYSVAGRPAEAALRWLPKYPAASGPALSYLPAILVWMATETSLPQSQQYRLRLDNDGWQTATYSVTVDSAAAIVPLIQNGSGSLAPTTSGIVGLTIDTGVRPAGVYRGELTIAAPGVAGAPFLVPVELRVVTNVERQYFPAIARP